MCVGVYLGVCVCFCLGIPLLGRTERKSELPRRAKMNETRQSETNVHRECDPFYDISPAVVPFSFAYNQECNLPPNQNS